MKKKKLNKVIKYVFAVLVNATIIVPLVFGVGVLWIMLTEVSEYM